MISCVRARPPYPPSVRAYAPHLRGGRVQRDRCSTKNDTDVSRSRRNVLRQRELQT